MAKPPLKAYYTTEEEFDGFHQGLKQFLCPHCRKRGYLILHGYLYGYEEQGDWSRRGHRVFCSNRNRKAGCGRTFPLLKSRFIKHFMISARMLFAMLALFSRGLCPSKIHGRLRDRISRTSIYRIYHRFRRNQPRIRTLLTRIKDPPDTCGVTDPFVQTIIHLKSAFSGSFVSRFQQFFQVSIL